jgi:AcrR family transcriptional regulator
MSRTVNERRPEELRSAIVEYLVKHGLSGLSLRPLAKAVGSSPRGLLYYFGSKEKMVVQVLAEVRKRQRASYGEVQGTSFAEVCRTIWKSISAAESERLFRLFFEAYGIALRQPKLYKEFLHATIEDWLELMADPLCREGVKREEARAFATVVLAGFRGFMLDYCTTHDRKRVDRAVAMWRGTLDSIVPDGKEGE